MALKNNLAIVLLLFAKQFISQNVIWTKYHNSIFYMITEYEKSLRDLQEREKVIIKRLQELDKRNQILKEIHENLKTRCFNQSFNRPSV